MDQSLLAAYCRHLREGYAPESFEPCDGHALERHVREHSEDFDLESLESARRAYLFFWERMGVRAMSGEDPKFNNTLYALQMKHRFGWGKDRPEEKEEMPLRTWVIVPASAHLHRDATDSAP